MERYKIIFKEDYRKLQEGPSSSLGQILNYYKRWNRSKLPMMPKTIKIRDRFNSAITDIYKTWMSDAWPQMSDEQQDSIRNKASQLLDAIHRYKQSL